MTHTCCRCARVNPGEAQYCYHDGAALMGQPGQGGPMRIGVQPFPQQFVFPSGRACRNFDQLALACQEQWSESLEVLRQGYLESFLGGLGRSDLALAAREAARYPDEDRGLDLFLARLPSDVVQPPKLAVEPTVINLGSLRVGEDRSFEVRLRNQGMRLVHGTATSDSVWLTVGDAPGTTQKLFQFGQEVVIGVHIRGKSLRASNKPLAGKLIVESNAGTFEIEVRAELPVEPFADGVLAGAKSPRQLAEKAKANPKDSAALFECGAVARWYEKNGWVYPVQGPTASGLAAIQQYFEALGLTPAPKVEVIPKTLAVDGAPGSQLKRTIELRTAEKRPIYAHASSNQPWLRPLRALLGGRSASIPIVIQVPDAPGQTLSGQLSVRANGNQRFLIPVKLTVHGGVGTATPAGPPTLAETTAPPPEAPRIVPARPGRPERPLLLPATLLLTALLGVICLDLMRKTPAPPPPPPFKDEHLLRSLPPGDPSLAISFRLDNDRFGLSLRDKVDPKNVQALKRLTFSASGDTNNTCVMVDGYENLYGQNPGIWVHKPRQIIAGRLWRSTWRYPQNVFVTQTVILLPDPISRRLDICLVHYRVENRDAAPHTVGLRFMLDTFIGANDGVPFLIPGKPSLMDRHIDIQNHKDMPDFVQATEFPDLREPGTVAHVGLKLPGDVRLSSDDPSLEPIHRLLITRWPGNPEIRWKIPLQDIGDDSCVAMYWEYRAMAPGETRVMAFTYGLGMVESEKDQPQARLAVTYGHAPSAGDTFTVTAYVKDAVQGQRVRIQLPAGMSLVLGSPSEQAVSDTGKRGISQVSWRVAVDAGLKPDSYPITVESLKAWKTIRVPVRGPGGIFDNPRGR